MEKASGEAEKFPKDRLCQHTRTGAESSRDESDAAIFFEHFSDGQNTSITFSEFQNNFNRAALAFQWTEKQKLAILPFYLKGLAKETFYTIPDGDKRTLESVFRKLKPTFNIPQMSLYFSFKLFSRKQGPGEPVSIFATDIQRLARRAFESQGEITIDVAGKGAFINVLRTHLKTQCGTHRTT